MRRVPYALQMRVRKFLGNNFKFRKAFDERKKLSKLPPKLQCPLYPTSQTDHIFVEFYENDWVLPYVSPVLFLSVVLSVG